MVNVNPTNTRPPTDTPEIRKYKKRFNSEILCAALWGENIVKSYIELHFTVKSMIESHFCQTQLIFSLSVE